MSSSTNNVNAGRFAGATRDGLLDVLGGGQSSSQHPSQVMGDSGAAYIAQLNAVCQFLRQEGFVQAERQLLQELEQKFPSIGKLSPEEEEEAGRCVSRKNGWAMMECGGAGNCSSGKGIQLVSFQRWGMYVSPALTRVCLSRFPGRAVCTKVTLLGSVYQDYLTGL